ncbi:MAG TPA: glycosyltransferase [Gemmatimonadaceae bacterium]|nr:glycosyltransferase [Gemmatimonadaceae bacterium]
MRIAVVTTYFPSVSQTFVLDQITGLIARAHDVDIYALAPEPNSAGIVPRPERHPLAHRTHYQPRTPRRRIGRALGIPALVHGAWHGRAGDALRIARDASPSALGVLYEGAPFVGRGPYDAILCHFGSNGERALRVRDAGIVSGPIVTAFHGADMSRYVRQHGAAVYRDLFARGDLFLPVSEFWAARLVELGCPADRIVVHHMGIDLSRFAFTPPRPPTVDQPIRIVAVARLVEKKGLAYAVRAVSALRRDGVDVALDIVGDGPMRAQLESLIGELGMSNAVRIIGARSREDVARVMGSAHLFVAPSVIARDGDMEGIPVALMEAMASGVPVVATRHSGIPELVRDQVSGLLVGERDVDALAGALRSLVDHPAQWLTLALAAHDAVAQDYNANKLTDALVGLLERAASGETGSARLSSTQRFVAPKRERAAQQPVSHSVAHSA